MKRIVLVLIMTLVCVLAMAEERVVGKEIILGQSIHLTGPLAELGKDFTHGAQLWFEYVNQNGGIYGRRIRLLTKDDAYNPTQAVDNAQNFIDQDVFCLFQFAGTGTVAEVSKVAEKYKIPLVSAIAPGPVLRSQFHPYTYYVRAGNSEEFYALIRHLNTMGLNRMAIVYINTSYGIEGKEKIEAIVSQIKNSTIVTTAQMEASGKDALEAAKTILKTSHDAVILVTVGKSSAEIVKAYKALGGNAWLYTVSAGMPAGVIKELGTLARGIGITQVMPSIHSRKESIVAEFREVFKKSGVEPKSINQLEGFINAKVLTSALEKAGKKLTRERFVQALNNFHDLDLGGFHIHYGPLNRSGSNYVDLSVIGATGSVLR